MKKRLERQTAYYENKLRKSVDCLEEMKKRNDKLFERNQEFEKYLVEGKFIFDQGEIPTDPKALPLYLSVVGMLTRIITLSRPCSNLLQYQSEK